MLKRAQRDDVYLKYVHVPLSKLWLLENGKTGGGYIVGLAGETEYNIVSWRCRALKRVVRSTMAGVTMALGDLLDEVENVQHTLKQILGDHLHAVARTDSPVCMIMCTLDAKLERSGCLWSCKP